MFPVSMLWFCLSMYLSLQLASNYGTMGSTGTCHAVILQIGRMQVATVSVGNLGADIWSSHSHWPATCLPGFTKLAVWNGKPIWHQINLIIAPRGAMRQSFLVTWKMLLMEHWRGSDGSKQRVNLENKRIILHCFSIQLYKVRPVVYLN